MGTPEVSAPIIGGRQHRLWRYESQRESVVFSVIGVLFSAMGALLAYAPFASPRPVLGLMLLLIGIGLGLSVLGFMALSSSVTALRRSRIPKFAVEYFGPVK